MSERITIMRVRSRYDSLIYHFDRRGALERSSGLWTVPCNMVAESCLTRYRKLLLTILYIIRVRKERWFW